MKFLNNIIFTCRIIKNLGNRMKDKSQVFLKNSFNNNYDKSYINSEISKQYPLRLKNSYKYQQNIENDDEENILDNTRYEFISREEIRGNCFLLYNQSFYDLSLIRWQDNLT